jgi:HEAT repeat protein
MGSKKNKAKKVLLQSSSPNGVVDDDLVDDLLAELDSRDKTVQEESAVVLEEIQAKQAIAPEKPNSSSKNRFKERQVRPPHRTRSSMVTSLSSRQGKQLHSLRSSHPSIPKRMRD